MNRPGYARPGYREGRGKRVKRMKVYKKMRMVDLVDAIRSVLQAPIPRRRPASDMNLQVLSSGVMKEELAHRFSVPEHQVAHALHILNLEGVVHQPTHGMPHDKRWGNSSMWCGDTYRVRDANAET